MKKTLGAARAQRMLFGLTCGSLLTAALGSGCSDPAVVSTGGAGGTGGAGTGAASSSTGVLNECSLPNDCPDPGNECVVRLCLNHACGVVNAAYGTPTATQGDGDCQQSVCDGKGETITIADNADSLTDDKQCTVDVCKAKVLSHDPAIAGTICSENGGFVCDGAGECVECISSATCPVGAVCSGGACVSPTCTDNVLNGNEVDVDCGGPDCGKCDVGKVCGLFEDCKSGLCVKGICASTTPNIVAHSPDGHDRFFNVTLDANDNAFATGITSPGTAAAADSSTLVAKFTPQGVLDTTWGTNGYFVKNLTVGGNGELSRAIGFQSTGKLIVGAVVDQVGAADPRDRDVALFRLNTDGTLDNTFGTGGVKIFNLSDGAVAGASFVADSIWHLVVQPDDKIVAHCGMVRAGFTDTDFVTIRVLADGSGLDNAFGTSGKVQVDVDNVNNNTRGLQILPDGSIISAGYYDAVGGVIKPVLYKMNSAGVLDATFGTGGIFTQVVLASQTEVYGFGIQGNKIITAGYGRENAATESLDWLSLRLLANGTIDPSYGNSAVPGLTRIDFGGFNDNARYATVLPDSRIVLNGGARPTANNVDGAIAILTPNGQPDTTFTPTGTKLIDMGGVNDHLWGLKVSSTGDYMFLAGIKGVANPAPAGEDDDAGIVLVPLK